VDKPGFLEFEPGPGVQVIQYIFHFVGVRLGRGVIEGTGEGVGET
jgi:hypothetical protein